MNAHQNGPNSSVGGNSELVKNGETGLLIEEGDAKTLRSAILRLLRSPETLQEMREKTKLAAKTFSFSKMVEETEQVLEDVSG